MKSNYLYFLIDIICLLLPFLFSFLSKAPFYKKWKYVSIAILIPAILFVIWDELFTTLGVWAFNSNYILGWRVGSLPVEEILFFLCVPYACIFTYFAVRQSERNFFFRCHELLSYFIIIALMIAGIYNIDKPYPAVTFMMLSFYLAFLNLKLRARYLGYFYPTFGIVLLPFFVVNGILSGAFIDEQVVWYNDEATLGIRLGTIPLEDIFYGMLLMLMNVSVYEWLQSSRQK